MIMIMIHFWLKKKLDFLEPMKIMIKSRSCVFFEKNNVLLNPLLNHTGFVRVSFALPRGVLRAEALQWREASLPVWHPVVSRWSRWNFYLGAIRIQWGPSEWVKCVLFMFLYIMCFFSIVYRCI